MAYLKKNKKAVSEVTSFVLITLVITIFSISAYVFSKSIVEDNVEKMDLENAKSYLQKISINLKRIENFHESSFSIPITINKGTLNFENNKISYQSLVTYAGDEHCFSDICYLSSNGYEKIYINLSSGYEFTNNFNLTPGNYLLYFKNLKNESKISLTIK